MSAQTIRGPSLFRGAHASLIRTPHSHVTISLLAPRYWVVTGDSFMMQQNAKIYAGMAAVRQQVLNWLYSVLTSVRSLGVFWS
jgi:hypothetical protein